MNGTESGNDYLIDDESPGSQVQGLVMRRSNAGGNLAQNDFIGSVLFNPKINGAFGYGGAGIAAFYRGNGTNSLTALAFRINSNQEAARIDENGNMGVATTTPTNTLDVNGTGRLRTINPATGSTIVTPVYSDANGVLLKASPSATYGGVTSNSVSVASGATGTLITGVVQGYYKVLVIVGSGCADSASAEFIVHNISPNNYFGIQGQSGFATSVGYSSPTFTQTVKTSVATTWSNITTCQDGGNGTALNYTVTMPAAGTINVTNNGNVAKSYKVVLTRLD